MAPIQKIETVVIVRPLKVVAFICGCITIFLLITSLASTVWLETAAGKYRLGLWQRCVDNGVTTPLPYGDPAQEGCYYHNSPPAWLLVTVVFCCIMGLMTVLATVFTAVGICTKKNFTLKYRAYTWALYLAAFGVVFMLVALILFPTMFSQEVANLGQKKWEFGWGYGVAWGAAIFLFGAAVLLLIDKESEEVYYREKTLNHESKA